MKLSLVKRKGTQGSVILVSLLVATIAGLTLASYLILAETQAISIYRSQTWNTCLTVSEAGVEDGLQLVNRYAGSFEPEDLPKWTNHTSAENWQTLAQGVYYMRRQIGVPLNNTSYYTNVYHVWVTNFNNTPRIYARAEVPWTHRYAHAPSVNFATIGVNTTFSDSSISEMNLLKRSIYVETKFDPLFIVAMAALDQIDLQGRNIMTDSFDSADPNFSDNGLYPMGQLAKTKDNGDVCTDLAIVDSLNVGNAKIRGRVRTGPGRNTINIGPNGSVGDLAWVQTTKGVKDGYSSTDFNVAFPSVVAPSGPWLPVAPVNTMVDGTNYQYVFDRDGYWYPSLPITGNVLVKAPSTAIVRVGIPYSVNFSGQEVIRIADTGALVRFYVTASSFQMKGQSYIDNESGEAYRFYLFGLPTCKTIYLTGNAAFYGGIYAPQADFTLGGGGNDVWDFVGASVTRTVFMNGHYNFHYDENLARIGPGRGYVPVCWNEK